jgi:hypothetical protein
VRPLAAALVVLGCGCTENQDLWSAQVILLVEKGGDGDGTIEAVPPGETCGATCRRFEPDTEVTLTAEADDVSIFLGWSGRCSGSGPCVVRMDRPTRVIGATFAAEQHRLRVGIDGMGRVVSTGGAIACPPVCEAEVPAGETVALEAFGEGGEGLAGWRGACDGSSDYCFVTVQEDVDVQVSFAPRTELVSLELNVEGPGKIRIIPHDIVCSGACRPSFQVRERIELFAVPEPGAHFDGWTGVCAGAGECVLTVIGNEAIDAEFSAGGGPILHYAFDGDLADTSRNGWHGTGTGAIAFVADRFSRAGRALYLDGSAYVERSDEPGLIDGLSRMTTCAWVLPAPNSGRETMAFASKIRHRDGDAETDALHMQLRVLSRGFVPASTLFIGRGEVSVDGQVVGSGWHHVCVSFDGDTANLFVDGRVAGTGLAPGAINDVDAPFRVGRCFGDPECAELGWIGAIDELKVWARALGPYEILKEAESYRVEVRRQPQRMSEGREALAVAATGPHIFAVAGGNDLGERRSTIEIFEVLQGGRIADPILSALPGPNRGAAAAAVGSHLFVVGGNTAASTSSREVVSAPLSGGTLGSFVFSMPLPDRFGRAGHGAVISNDTMFVAGGGHDAQLPEVYAGRISEGVVEGWIEAAPLPQPRSGAAVVVVGDAVVVAGGAGGTVHVARPMQGTIDDWIEATPLPQAILCGAGFVHGDHVFVAGGMGIDGVSLDTIYAARLTSDGLGPWLEVGRLIEPRRCAGAAVVGNVAFVIGGRGSGLAGSDVVDALFLF